MFKQNNSGGSFHFDANRGISHYVIIEAGSKQDAVNRAEMIGLYFDGYGDCECCGNRWYEPWDDGTVMPAIYGKAVASYDFGNFKCIKGPECFVHYSDGTIMGFGE